MLSEASANGESAYDLMVLKMKEDVRRRTKDARRERAGRTRRRRARRREAMASASMAMASRGGNPSDGESVGRTHAQQHTRRKATMNRRVASKASSVPGFTVKERNACMQNIITRGCGVDSMVYRNVTAGEFCVRYILAKNSPS